MESDLVRTQKQSYLRTHVLEQGFSAEEFAEFLASEKEEGANVDNWSIHEIETLVDLFKRSHDKPGQFSKYKLQDIDLDVPLSLTQDFQDEIYTKRIKTQKKEPNSLGDAQVRISIPSYEKIDGGFFSGTHIYFIIHIVNTEVQAKRKIQDFVWFREQLCKEFPVSYIPPLAMTESRSGDNEYLDHQMVCLTVVYISSRNSSRMY